VNLPLASGIDETLEDKYEDAERKKSPHGNRRHLNIQFDGIIIFQKSGTIFCYNKRNNFLHLVFCLMKIFEFAVVVVGSNIALGLRTREKILLFLMFLILNTTYQTSG
jgi:hypothetical protein